MKFLISLAAIAALTVPATAEAHNCGCTNAHGTAPAAQAAPVVAWVWVPATRVGIHHVVAHWYHPRYGKEYTNHRGGRPVARPNRDAVWTPGHWEGRRRNRHWVSGRWSPKPSVAHSRHRR